MPVRGLSYDPRVPGPFEHLCFTRPPSTRGMDDRAGWWQE